MSLQTIKQTNRAQNRSQIEARGKGRVDKDAYSKTKLRPDGLYMLTDRSERDLRSFEVT